MWKKHPRALPYLFFSEMWERFGYYLMIGIFTLYLKKPIDEGAFNMSEADAATVYGLFIALVYITPFIGGMIADRFLGYRRSIIIGGILMGLGYSTMAIHSYTALYGGMALVIIGNGFFKPNISTLLGNIYSRPGYESKKDEGYNIFYMGVNTGAFICNFIAAALRIVYGWPYAFLAAGIGMFIGILIFISGNKHYHGADVRKPALPGEMSLPRFFSVIILPSIIAGFIGWYLPGTLLGKNSTDAFIFACIPVVYLYASVYFKSSKTDKRPVAALLAIFLSVIMFWAVFKQNGSALTTWADNYTDRSVPAGFQNVFAKLKQADTVQYKLKSRPFIDEQFRKKHLQDEQVQVAVDSFIKAGLAGSAVTEFTKKMKDSFLFVNRFPDYYNNVAKEKLPKEGSKELLWSTNISQSINPGWVILLTPVLLVFFGFLKRKNKEPGTPTKIAFGILISAISVLVMVAAVKAGNNGSEKVSVWWLFATYGIITVGELLLSPMGLSIVSKLSPPRITSLMMGGWMLAISIGNMLSGVLASAWDKYDDKASYFWLNFILLILAAAILFSMLKWLNRIMKEKGIH
jgi:POT family proton-dependent oligopeptide transporter